MFFGRVLKAIPLFFLFAFSLILVASCTKNVDFQHDGSPVPEQVTLPLPADSSILHISYLPEDYVFLVGDANNGSTWIIDRAGTVLGESKKQIYFTSTCNGRTLAWFIDNPELDLVHIEGDQLSLEPTNWRPRTAFTLLPHNHLVTFDFDLGDQVREIERKVGILLQAGKDEKEVNETLINELIHNDNIEESDMAAEFHQWTMLADICEEYYGRSIGIEELSPVIRRDHIGLVKILDREGRVLGQVLKPPIVDGAGFASLRAWGCAFKNRIYVVNTIEPALYVMEYSRTEQTISGPTLNSREDFTIHLESIPDTIFEYRAPSEEVRRRYPHISFPFTPTWEVFSLQDGLIVARVADHATRNSVLVLYRDDSYQGLAVTVWTPMSSDGNILIMMKPDSDNNTIQLRTFSNEQQLTNFIVEEAEYFKFENR